MIGQTLDRKYRLLRLLGEGGMGAVYEAEHAAMHRRVAVKVLNGRRLAPGRGGVQRFRREAVAAGAIDDAHIVQVLDAGTDEETGTSYIVMELLQGEDLQQRIDQTGALPADVVLRIGAQALAGLQRAHEAHVVHRDIKPANLFLAERPGGELTVKVLDFGIAKIVADPLLMPHTAGLTNTDSFLGSPLYMSPEQVLNSRDVDHRTDLWSLASALYCALAGHAPHQQVGTVGRLIFSICSSPPPPLHEVAPWVPLEVSRVLHGALALEVEKRYPSAAAMLEAIRPLLQGGAELHESMMLPAVSARRLTSYAPTLEQAPLDEEAGVEAEGAAGRTDVAEGDRAAPVDSEAPRSNKAPPARPEATLVAGLASARPEATLVAGPAAARPEATLVAGLASASAGKPATAGEVPSGNKEVNPAATRPGDSSAPVETSLDDQGAPRRAPGAGSSRRARWARPMTTALTGVVLLGALGVFRAYKGPEGLPSQAGRTGAAAPLEPESLPPSSLGVSGVSRAPMVAPAAPFRRVQLAVIPGDASVEVDSRPARVSGGRVELEGALGSVHRVRISKGKEQKQVDIFITELGAHPPKVELRRVPARPTKATRPPAAPPGPPDEGARPPLPSSG
ncbi:protein kinase domain-containing protein [Sorangium sp. So ce131]|uniref:serine/threonine-protein kinase n=1 Tax=Sorangium sp. So ce131 TaxID=3133282 RepID=UPI003F5D9C6C